MMMMMIQMLVAIHHSVRTSQSSGCRNRSLHRSDAHGPRDVSL